MMRDIALAVAITLAPVTGQAQSTPDAATLAAARDLLAATDVRGQMRALMPRMADAVGNQIRSMFTENEVPDGLRQQMTAAIQANLASMDTALTPQVIDRMAAIYARHFSASELQRLTALMRDPAMAKFRAEMPNIMPVMFAAVKPQQDVFQLRMRQIIMDWLRTHPQDRAKLRSPTAS